MEIAQPGPRLPPAASCDYHLSYDFIGIQMTPSSYHRPPFFALVLFNGGHVLFIRKDNIMPFHYAMQSRPIT